MADIYSSWDGTFQGNTQISESEEKEYLVKYPKDKGGHFSMKFREKKRPIGFLKNFSRK